MSINRRDFIKGSVAAGLGVGIGSLVKSSDQEAFAAASGAKHRVLILGIDGMDPELLLRYVNKGIMPNFAKLIKEGDFKPLGTTIPPQSPVAWATFITGLNPGGHGIFDFIHRKTGQDVAIVPGEPYLSTSSTVGGETWQVGDWVIPSPFSPSKVELLRQGKPFWAFLTERGIPATVCKCPSNYPPDPFATKAISCMGTPDMTGGYGTFSYYTDFPPKNSEKMTGGKVYPVEVKNHRVEGELYGPRNEMKKDRKKLTIPFTVHVDPENDAARLVVQDQTYVLNKGEWTDWIQLRFTVVPGLVSVYGICRFYLKGLQPDFQLYVTPINVDPSNPVLPISHPESYAKEIQSSVGFYYTQGMPEDTKALSNKVFTDEEFMQQSRFVMEERLRMYDFELGRFKQGLLFFYFTSLDQNSHMLWHALDESHPIHEKDKASICCQYMEFLYHSMDEMLGKTLKTIDDNTTLIIMSDHGFASFRRCFQINTWLKENGYITLHDDFKQEEYEFFGNVDWSRTKAYNLGINSVYLNLRGREQKGTVDPSQKDALLKEISEKLLAVRDPENGEQVITKVYKTSEVYRGAYVDIAPDLVLGFNRGYRASWETILGGFPLGIVNDNEDKWSGDHCMASDLVPGVILSNKKIEIPDPTLADIGPTVLQEYGIEPSKEMEGRALFDTNAAPAAIKPVV